MGIPPPDRHAPAVSRLRARHHCPAAPVARRRELFAGKKGTLSIILYYGCLGLGYMMAEIFLIQRFVYFLADPVYANAIVITALLDLLGNGQPPQREGEGPTDPDRALRDRRPGRPHPRLPDRPARPPAPSPWPAPLRQGAGSRDHRSSLGALHGRAVSHGTLCPVRRIERRSSPGRGG